MKIKKAAKIICSRNCTYNSKDCEKGCKTFKDVLQMARWQTEQLIEKSVKWIEDNDLFRCYPQQNGSFHYMKAHIIEDFKKAMEED